MRLTHTLRAGAAALVLVGAAAADHAVFAQSGAPAGDATGISRPLGVGTMQSLFPQTVMPLPQGGGGVAGFTDRVKTRSTNLPDREGLTLINVGTPYVNAIFGGIPDGAGLAGGIEFTTADKLGSQFELYGDAIVSIRKYRRFEAGAVIGKERDRGEVRFRYTRRVKDNFFGLGPFSDQVPVVDPVFGPVGGETNFDHEERAFQAGYSHYFDPNRWAVGVYVAYTSASIYEGDDDADPSIFLLYRPYTAIEAAIPVSEAVFSSQLPGLGAGSKVFSYGVYTEADYRNENDGLTKGGYAYLRFASHTGTDSSDLNTFVGPVAFGWNQFTADLRGYIPLFNNKNSLALRFYTDLNHNRGGDVIPFYELARIGGPSSLRGFDTFRFYGANSLFFQGEYRRTVYTWGDDEVSKGVDINIFGDAGQVWELGYDARVFQPSIPSFERSDSFDFDNYEADGGFGVTVRVSKGFALRLDYGHSNESNKVRLGFTRGF